jgi:hypothetical protein
LKHPRQSIRFKFDIVIHHPQRIGTILDGDLCANRHTTRPQEIAGFLTRNSDAGELLLGGKCSAVVRSVVDEDDVLG